MTNPNPANQMTTGKRVGGRQKGTPNKITTKLKDMIDGALDELGGITYLKWAARQEPAAFLALLGKTLPRDLKLGGDLSLEVNLVQRSRQTTD